MTKMQTYLLLTALLLIYSVLTITAPDDSEVLGFLVWGIRIVITIMLIGQYLGPRTETLGKLSSVNIPQLLYVILTVYGFEFYPVAQEGK